MATETKTHETDQAHAPERGARDRKLTLLAASLGFAVVQLDVSVVNVAIKPIGAELGGGVDALQWIVSAYTITFAALILTAGTLGDRLGARRVFVAGFGLFTVASALCGIAPSLAVLIGARALQGVGAAMLVPCSLTLLNHTFPDEERARAVGFWAAGASIALAGGPLVGGALIAAIGWRAIFFINAPVGALGIYLTLRHAGETSRSPGSFDLGGQTLAIAALSILAGATIEGGARGFGDPFVLAGFAVAALAAVGFLRLEARRRSPMLPLGLFDSPVFASATAIGLLVNVVFYGLIFLLSLFFQQVEGYSAIETGLAFVPSTVAVMAGNLLAGRAAERFGPARVMTTAALLMAASLAGLLVLDAGVAYPALVAQLLVLGFGLGLVVPVMTAALLGSVDARQSGVASGVLNTSRQTGSVIGVALFGSLGASGVVAGLHASVLIAIGLSLAVAVLGRFLVRGDATR
jgi:MFS transporter, DHA2 family, methylenomycin A resistance protein